MTRIDRFALLLCLCSLIANAQVAARVFENLPHLEDEMTYIWQAKVISGGNLLIPSPPSPGSFLVPFVIDYQGWRFGKYPLGFPVLLGPSRKSFIGYTLNLPPDQRIEGTAAAVCVGIVRGADIIRVHDVEMMARVARMTDAIVRQKA